MSFQIGDTVIHCRYGLGEIIGYEEKLIQGSLRNCYVFSISTLNLLVWIPMSDAQEQTLRTPALPEEFERLSAILTGLGEVLPEDRMLRKTKLMDQIKDGQLASICTVIRDLTSYRRLKKLNEQESSILERAVNSLLTEWSYSKGIPLHQARQALAGLLEGAY